ncbi:MAG TPA: ribosome maturation factor RimM [Candidatus Binatia bacterium]|nr:ribosome maturation factor RimM [Candidatus Binatia bacterium]
MPGRDAPAAVAVAEVVGAHGLRGLLRVHPYQPPAPSLARGRTVVLEREGVRQTARIASVAPHGRGRLLVGLAGVADRSAAEALAGARILVHTDELPAPGAGEFYYHEVVGFAVATTAGEPLGRITETFSTGLNDVWVVRDDRREVLLPVIADVVRTIDRPARRVVVVPLPGLLD